MLAAAAAAALPQAALLERGAGNTGAVAADEGLFTAILD